MKLIVAGDYKTRGFREKITEMLKGTFASLLLEPDEFHDQPYPVVAERVCLKVQSRPDTMAVLVCRTGIGMCIVANKFRGIRAVNGTDLITVAQSRWRNNCNILCLGASNLTEMDAFRLIREFTTQEYLGQSDSNIKSIDEIERRNFK